MTVSSVFPTMNLHGHTMVRAGDLWVSRAPFTNGDWFSNAVRLRADHKRYGILTETRVGNELRHSLDFCSTRATLRDRFGGSLLSEKDEAGTIYFGENSSAVAFEFFLWKGIKDRLGHPVVGKTYYHAQGMCLAIGADLMTDEQYVKIVQGPTGNRRYATPKGELFGPNGEEYVVSSLKNLRSRPVDVEDPSFPTDPLTGTRHYTGNVDKWMKKTKPEGVGEYSFCHRGGSWMGIIPEDLDVSRRIVYSPDDPCVAIGFLAAMHVTDSL